jgi:hypothetical protein
VEFIREHPDDYDPGFEARGSLATLWARIFRRAGDGAQGHSEALSGHSEDGTDWGERRATWLTELLARASRGVDNDEQDFAPRSALTQNGRGVPAASVTRSNGATV